MTKSQFHTMLNHKVIVHLLPSTAHQLLISFPINYPSLILAHSLLLINPVRFECGTGVAHLVHTYSSTYPFCLGKQINDPHSL